MIFKEGLQKVFSLAAELRAKLCNHSMLDFKSLPLGVAGGNGPLRRVSEAVGAAGGREEQSFSLLRSGVSQVSPYRSRNRLKVGCFRRSGPIDFSLAARKAVL